MDKVASLPEDKRRELFLETGVRKKMTPAIVEKDFWVCWTLMRLFTSSELAPQILFKGGTSLSKVFHVIERFSEDIDLILDWRVLAQDDPNVPRSKTQQDKWNKSLLEKANEYISSILKQNVQKAVGSFCRVDVSDKDPFVICVHYPGVFADRYLRPEIRLEIGSLASWIPHGEYDMMPYAAEIFPDIFSVKLCRVKAIKAERTFWEKVTILHKEAFRLSDNVQPSRYSRHYYDVSRMFHASGMKESAFANLDLLEKVVQFKQRFYPSAWARYDLAKPGSIKMMPPKHCEQSLYRDYESMRDMIFGEYPKFDDILKDIEALEQEINQRSPL